MATDRGLDGPKTECMKYSVCRCYLPLVEAEDKLVFIYIIFNTLTFQSLAVSLRTVVSQRRWWVGNVESGNVG